MGTNDCVAYRIAFFQLYLDTLAQWWKHLGKYNLLVPHRRVGILFH